MDVQAFCCPAHRQRFHHLNAARGQVVVPFLQIARNGKNGRTAETAYAFSQMSALGDLWNAEDRDAGRRPDLVVRAKFDAKWSWADVDRRGGPGLIGPAIARPEKGMGDE